MFDIGEQFTVGSGISVHLDLSCIRHEELASRQHFSKVSVSVPTSKFLPGVPASASLHDGG